MKANNNKNISTLNNDDTDIDKHRKHYNKLLVSKMCHDLITPAGAMVNGLELLNTNEQSPEIMQLLEQSAKTLTAKLIMFRACFGANAMKIVANADSLSRTIKPFFDIYKIKVEELDIDDSTPNFSTKAIMLVALSMLAAEIIPFGGGIGAKFTQNGCYFILKGKMVERKQEVINVFNSNKKVEVDVKNIMILFIKELVMENSFNLKVVELGPNEMMFTF